MSKNSILDIKLLARILYDNRAGVNYLTKSGQQRILEENGHKLSRPTFELHYNEIRAEIDKLHDAAFRKETRPAERERMAELFSQMDYIVGLKRIWDGEPNTQGKYPQFRDQLQAGKQAAEYFGWDASKKTETKHTIEGLFMEAVKNGDVKIPQGEDPNKSFSEIK